MDTEQKPFDWTKDCMPARPLKVSALGKRDIVLQMRKVEGGFILSHNGEDLPSDVFPHKLRKLHEALTQRQVSETVKIHIARGDRVAWTFGPMGQLAQIIEKDAARAERLAARKQLKRPDLRERALRVMAEREQAIAEAGPATLTEAVTQAAMSAGWWIESGAIGEEEATQMVQRAATQRGLEFIQRVVQVGKAMRADSVVDERTGAFLNSKSARPGGLTPAQICAVFSSGGRGSLGEQPPERGSGKTPMMGELYATQVDPKELN
jgi:hypothetical protein